MRTWSKRSALVLVAAAVVAAPTGAQAATPKLVGNVGPGETIALTKAGGAKVTSLKRGTYSIVVRDRSDEHNFRLRGPGVNKMITSVDFVGTKTVKVTLRAGSYTFVCDPHADEMRGSFRAR
jgi:plastocyanin